MSMHQPSKCVLAVALKVLGAIDSPEARSVERWIKLKDWESIANYRVDPSTFKDLGSFRKAWQAAELLRKYVGLLPRSSQRKVAFEGFVAAERQCAETNARLDRYFDPLTLTEDWELRMMEFIHCVRKKVRSILGPLPRTLDLKFGPGLTFESEGRAERKSWCLGDKITTYARTSATSPFLKFVDETAWGKAQASGEFQWIDTVVRGNRFTTVLKDALKDRGICIEPGINVSLQLAVGGEIRRRLRSENLDLQEDQTYHRYLVTSSFWDEIATIDLSSASDTVARKLVELLLPTDWYRLLNSLRSPLTRVKGKWYYLEKFSSMGNGFTFELETLIFYAIARSICPDSSRVSVYGDDIIVPKEAAAAVIGALRFFGFSPNPKKTFADGPFRESCGADAYEGNLVPVFRFADEPCGPLDWYAVHNRLRTLGFPLRVLRAVVDQIPKAQRLYGPPSSQTVQVDEVGRLTRLLDNSPTRDHFIECTDRALWKTKESGGCVYARGLVARRRKISYDYFPPSVQLAIALYGNPSDGVPLRGAKGSRRRWFSIS